MASTHFFEIFSTTNSSAFSRAFSLYQGIKQYGVIFDSLLCDAGYFSNAHDIFRILLFLLITQTPRTNNQPAV
jgi:hypothetical protein